MDRRRKHERLKSAASAEVGPLPEVVDPRRRWLCGEDLLLFLATYFPESTSLCNFSPDHARMIGRIQSCIENGGRFANAVYRGFAKTTIAELAALWAELYHKREFTGIYGANKQHAREMLESIRSELEENDLLLEDFPEVCVPFRHLEGRSQRGSSQTFEGKLTHIKMTSDTLIFPTLEIDGKKVGGGIIRAKGLEGANRGMKFKRPDGRNARPDFFIIDDPQTDEAARNSKRVGKLFDFIRKGILKSAGHRGKAAACVINGTVIEHGDFMDQILDRKLNKSWQTERLKLVDKWSDAHDTLWVQYRDIRHDFGDNDEHGQENAVARATEFYRTHRDEMDAGCQVRWIHCHYEGELSAIQHAYNLYFDDPVEVFASEMQNEPTRAGIQGVRLLSAREVSAKVNGLPRLIVPAKAEFLTSFIDIHDDLLYWMLCSWKSDFTGDVVAYGAWPEQPSLNFTRNKVHLTLVKHYAGLSVEGAIVQGLEDLIDEICGVEYLREDTTPINVGSLGVDGGYKLDEAEAVARKTVHRSLVQITRGKGVTAGQLPISEYERRPNWRFGNNWYIKPDGSRSVRILWFDSNYWKTFVQQRLATPTGVAGALSLYGTETEIASHRSLGEHVTIEKPTETWGRGRKVIQWDNPPGGDNHWGDCLVGCAVAADRLGCKLPSRKRSDTRTKRGKIKDAAKKAGVLLD